jgi:hypothetical protein
MSNLNKDLLLTAIVIISLLLGACLLLAWK